MDFTNYTGAELAQLQIELTKAIYRYCEGLTRYSTRNGRLAPQDIRDFGAYLSKQKYKYDKKIEGIEPLIVLLDTVGSHSKAEWYNHIYRYRMQDYDLQLIHDRRTEDEETIDEDEEMID